MGYQNTPAHHTASAAWQAGDDVWPGNDRLIIRRANVYAPTDDLEMPGADLGWMESIGPAIQAITALGKTAYDIRRSQLDKQHARNAENDAILAAAEASKRAESAAAAAAAATAKQTQLINASAGLPINQTTALLGVAALAVVGLGAYFLLRKK